MRTLSLSLNVQWFFVVRDEDRMKTVVDTSIMTYGYSMVTAEMRKFQQETENTVNRNMDGTPPQGQRRAPSQGQRRGSGGKRRKP